MAVKYYCDGGCGQEIMGGSTDLMIRRPGEGAWRRHALCDDCARRNVFLIDKNGKHVFDHGFASDVLR